MSLTQARTNLSTALSVCEPSLFKLARDSHFATNHLNTPTTSKPELKNSEKKEIIQLDLGENKKQIKIRL